MLGILGSWFGGANEPWRKLARKGVSDVMDEDTGELIDIHPPNGDPGDVEGVLVQFDYEDGMGNPSHRVLLCWKCWQASGTVYVQGYCTKREALRTFRPDRMSRLSELRSGRDIADPVAYFSAFAEIDSDEREWLAEQARAEERQRTYDAARKAKIEAEAVRKHLVYQARRQCISGLRVLAYIVLADGMRSEAERAVEAAFIKARLAACGLPEDPTLVAELVDVSRALAVPDGSFKSALKQIKAEPDYATLVLACAGELAMQGSLTSSERKALEQVLRALAPG